MHKYFLLTSYTLIMFLSFKSLYNESLKKIMKYFKEVVLKYFKISVKFLNISKWNILSLSHHFTKLHFFCLSYIPKYN